MTHFPFSFSFIFYRKKERRERERKRYLLVGYCWRLDARNQTTDLFLDLTSRHNGLEEERHAAVGSDVKLLLTWLGSFLAFKRQNQAKEKTPVGTPIEGWPGQLVYFSYHYSLHVRVVLDGHPNTGGQQLSMIGSRWPSLQCCPQAREPNHDEDRLCGREWRSTACGENNCRPQLPSSLSSGLCVELELDGR